MKRCRSPADTTDRMYEALDTLRGATDYIRASVLGSMIIDNFTAFGPSELKFADGLNVFVGENGTGKSHLLKLPYSVIATSASGARRNSGERPTKGPLQRDLAQKLNQVFRPESLGRLARRQRGRARCEVEVRFHCSEHTFRFSFSSQSTKEVVIDTCPTQWVDKAPVFLPAHELLTVFPGFVSIYDSHYLQFDETWRDTCQLLGAAALKGAREQRVVELLEPLEKQMGGRLSLDENGRFYLRQPGVGNLEIHLVAEGIRKLAMLARLIATGSLLDQGVLFWDEPESNLNSKLVRGVAESILQICSHGVQIFVATHSLFLLRELETLLKEERFADIGQRYFALSPNADGVEVQQGDSLDDVGPLVALDEELLQSDRFLEAHQ